MYIFSFHPHHQCNFYIISGSLCLAWNFEETFTHPSDVEKLARKLAKSSVKFLELDYVILELDEETEEKIYQTLSAVECLLIKCHLDPKYMSPTFSEPNFGATLVEKKSWNQKFIKVNDRIIKGTWRMIPSCAENWSNLVGYPAHMRLHTTTWSENMTSNLQRRRWRLSQEPKWRLMNPNPQSPRKSQWPMGLLGYETF